MPQSDNYSQLIAKLDQFIRKYYINQLIRGSLYTLGFILSLFLVVSLLEHNFYFSVNARKGLFFGFLLLSTGAAYFWIFRPLLQYFRLGKVISHAQAASIIGDHFQSVQDRLLNILQLKEQSEQEANNSLLLAGIDQKAEQIKLVPFRKAIDLSKNRKYARYALPPLLLLLILLFAAPSMIKDSTYRLINNNQEFERPAPFSFELVNSNLEVVQYENFPIEVLINGNQLPNEVYVEVEGFPYRMKKLGPNRFAYQFNNVQKNIGFRLVSTPVSSKEYTLEVLQKPNIMGLEVDLDYPSYTGRKDERLSNIGDLSVPTGTQINWNLNTAFTDTIWMFFAGSGAQEQAQRKGTALFSFQKQALKSELYKLYISNINLPKADSVTYSISVTPDRYPVIEAQEFVDSTLEKVRFFAGNASDDYGLLNLSFNYQLTDENGRQQPLQTVKLANPNGKKVAFDHYFDLTSLGLKPGEQVTYYFEVYDNDAINGNKVARTQLMQFAMPTVEEFKAMAEANDEKIKKNLEESLRESKQIQEDLKEARDKLLQEKELNWQNRKELEKLLERQQQLQLQLQEAQEDFNENLQNQDEFSEQDEETRKKQEKLQKLFEETINEETLELMQKIQELLEELDKDQALEMMEEMQMDDEEMELEIDRLLELYKKLELEQELQETREQLEELAEDQEELSQKTEETDSDLENEENESDSEQEENNTGEQEEGEENQKTENQEGEKEQGENQNNQEENQGQQEKSEQEKQTQDQKEQNQAPQDPQEQIQKEQEQINQEFQQIMEQMEQIEQKNQELENPQNLGDQQEQMEQIQQDLEQIQQQLQKQENQGASQKQKKAAQQMRQMAQEMQSMMQSGQMQQMSEDIDALRQLLENLVGLSFDQEDLIEAFTETNLNTPKYVSLIQDQFKLKDDFGLVEDSLQALAKRVFQIESYVTEKVSEINSNLDNSIEELEERRISPAIDHQQRTMKNVNDLALMLSETLNQMQQQMASMMMSMQKSQQPGQQSSQQGQEPKDRISKGQQKLNEDMRKASEQMRRQREGGEGGSAKEFAEMARRQAELRKALEEKQKELRQSGQGDPKIQEILEKMDQIEKDLVNKKLTNELLQRQQDIISRLLEFENAERQQEFEEKRKSETARQVPPIRPQALEEYLRKREAEVEQYKTVSPNLKPYFKSLVEEYLKKLSETEGQ